MVCPHLGLSYLKSTLYFQFALCILHGTQLSATLLVTHSKCLLNRILPWSWNCPGSESLLVFFWFFFWLFFCIFEFYFIYFLYSMFLLVIHFIHISVYMSVPISQFIAPSPPPPPLSPLDVHTFVLYICVSISALQTGSSVPFF